MQGQRLSRSQSSPTSAQWTLNITLSKDGESIPCFTHECKLEVSRELNFLRVPLAVEIQPGLYHLSCHAVSEEGEVRMLRQGFWGYDVGLLSQGEAIKAGRDYFIKDGQPLPVVGMTYMTSDVARKFLFLPNADVWDRDMAQMRKAGINWIRT